MPIERKIVFIIDKPYYSHDCKLLTFRFGVKIDKYAIISFDNDIDDVIIENWLCNLFDTYTIVRLK